MSKQHVQNLQTGDTFWLTTGSLDDLGFTVTACRYYPEQEFVRIMVEPNKDHIRSFDFDVDALVDVE